jgi:radical SAM superfamily enzyme YgiQ (UPF0313 family)
MKKIGIITLTRQNSLAYSTLKRIVADAGYHAVCGEAIGVDSIYLPLEELSVVGYDDLSRFFDRAGFSETDTLLISAPYSVNLFVLPKVIWCLRSVNPAPIVLGGNEASNNYKNLMQHRYMTFAHRVVDIAPDFIVRGAAETALPMLLPLLDKTTMTTAWNSIFIRRLLEIPNMVFWLPARQALFSTQFSAAALLEKDIYAQVKYGEKTVAVTFQRACIWSKKSRGGCLFCAISSQFGKDFHCSVHSDFFVADLTQLLKNDPDIRYIDIWDDTFNINEDWALKICGYLDDITKAVGREITYSCFLRPKGLTEKLTRKMGASHIKVAFIGADALTEDLSKRLRRGCTVAEINQSIQLLRKGKILPRLSVQLFSPEATIDDCGITAALALSCIRNGESTVHVHLYTFPLFGSDLFRLLESRCNLIKMPTPLLSKETGGGFTPYAMAYDYIGYDPDLEEIKQKTYRLLGITASFFVKTYPGDTVDGRKLKEILTKVRRWCLEAKKNHPIKSLWLMTVLCLENPGDGLDKAELLDILSKNDRNHQVPTDLKNVYGNFGFEFTLARSFDEVAETLLANRWVRKDTTFKYHLTAEGRKALMTMANGLKKDYITVASYGKVHLSDLRAHIMNRPST